MNNVLDFIKKNKIGKYKSNESLSKYTTFKVGGNAKVIVYPVNEDKLIELLRYLNKNNIMYKVIGNGSNLIFSDKEYDGVIIKLDEFKKIEIKDTIILVEALNTQKEIIVGTNHTNKSLSTGDLINIEYDGEIEESNPPSITALRIEKLDNRDLLY